MRVAAVRTLGFRNLAPAELELGEGITLLWGPNGAGKTNALEALCLALSGRSCRTRNEREAIAFGEQLARVEVEVADGGETRTFLWSLARAGERRHLVDENPVDAGALPSCARRWRSSCPTVWRWSRARRPCAERISTACARRCGRRAPSCGGATAGRSPSETRSWSGSGADPLPRLARRLGARAGRAGLELIAARREAVDLLAPEFAEAAADSACRETPAALPAALRGR